MEACEDEFLMMMEGVKLTIAIARHVGWKLNKAFKVTSNGAVSIQLSDARRASRAGENMRSSSSSSSSWYQCILENISKFSL